MAIDGLKLCLEEIINYKAKIIEYKNSSLNLNKLLPSANSNVVSRRSKSNNINNKSTNKSSNVNNNNTSEISDANNNNVDNILDITNTDQQNIDKLISYKISVISITNLKRLYSSYTSQIINSLVINPIDTSDIIIERLNKRIQESINQKSEQDKAIKSSYDKFYPKSFDYRSFKFKNNDKKNTNAKAFIKEIIKRSSDKLSSNNVNVLKGGNECSEFYKTFFNKNNNLLSNQLLEKSNIHAYNNNNSSKYNDAKTIKPDSNKSKQKINSCLLEGINDEYLNSFIKNKNKQLFNVNNFKRYLPDLRFNFKNIFALKSTIYVILLYINNSYNSNDSSILISYVMFFFEQIFSFKIDNSIIFNNSLSISKKDESSNNINNINSKSYLLNFIELLKSNSIENEEEHELIKKILSDVNTIAKPYTSSTKKEDNNILNSNMTNIASPKLSNKSAIYIKGKKDSKSNFSVENLTQTINTNEDQSSEFTLTPSLESNDKGQTYKKLFTTNDNTKNIDSSYKLEQPKNYDNSTNNNNYNIFENKMYFIPHYLPKLYVNNKKTSSKSNVFFCNESYYVVIRFIFCIYERICKLTESNKAFDINSILTNNVLNIKNKQIVKDNNNNNNITCSSILNQNTFKEESKIKLCKFLILFNGLCLKKIENSNQFEEICRDILGNESYFLLNFDKLIQNVCCCYYNINIYININ